MTVSVYSDLTLEIFIRWNTGWRKALWSFCFNKVTNSQGFCNRQNISRNDCNYRVLQPGLSAIAKVFWYNSLPSISHYFMIWCVTHTFHNTNTCSTHISPQHQAIHAGIAYYSPNIRQVFVAYLWSVIRVVTLGRIFQVEGWRGFIEASASQVWQQIRH
jgi:hypothetical protein